MSVDHSSMRLGKREARRDPRTLKLGSFLSTAPALVPHKRIDWSLGVNSWPMYLNDQIGNCAIAGPAHMIQAWTNNKGSEIVLPDSDVIHAYSEVSGYVPGDDSTDNGCVMLDVLNYWRRTGIGGHKIEAYAYVYVNPLNRAHVSLAIDLLGGAVLGVRLPLTAQTQEIWSLLNNGGGAAKPGSWGGHCVVAVNYGPAGVVVVTWGRLLTLTWEFLELYCDEIFAVFSPDWASDGSDAPNHVNAVALREALQAATG
jgi:hypothetical protein